MDKFVDGLEFGNALIKAGIVPDIPLKRIVLDIQIDEVVTVYYEALVDEKTLDLCLEELIKNKDKLKVKNVNG